MVNGLLNLCVGLGWALALYVGLFSSYMLWILLGAWLARGRRDVAHTGTFAVLVPAHNEEQGIAHTVRQLRAAAYPSDRLRIVVIADNCTDATAERASEAGAHVVRRADLVNRGKGQALGWVLKEHRELLADRDLIAIVDADMNVDPDFFAAMAREFNDPAVMIAQGRYVISNPQRGVLSAIGFTSFCYVNHVRPAGRCFWGGTAELKGSGMVFRSGFLLDRGWNAHSIAEDTQFGKEQLLQGVRVQYVPDARVDSDIPATLAQVKVQQSRWEGGKREIYRSMFPRTFQALVRRPSILLLDGAMDLLVPPLSIVVVLNLVGLLLTWWTASAVQWVFVASLAVFAGAVLTGLLQNRAPAGVYLRLIAAPAFIVWKLALLVRVALARSPAGWQRTPRDRRE